MSKCCCGRGTRTPTGKAWYCTKHGWQKPWRPTPPGHIRGYVHFAPEPATDSLLVHSTAEHADFVISKISTWMVPGTYDAEADAPPLPMICTLCGYKFNPDNGEIELHGLHTAQGLRYLADLIERHTMSPGVDHVYINGKPALI